MIAVIEPIWSEVFVSFAAIGVLAAVICIIVGWIEGAEEQSFWSGFGLGLFMWLGIMSGCALAFTLAYLCYQAVGEG